jgi:hypothetical protein
VSEENHKNLRVAGRPPGFERNPITIATFAVPSGKTKASFWKLFGYFPVFIFIISSATGGK